MKNRRHFLSSSLASLGALTLLPQLDLFASPIQIHASSRPAKLRFALASDGHYAQPGTDGDQHYSDLVSWINREHYSRKLDFVIINGDLVHDRPDLLSVVKTKYLDTLHAPFYATQGNHDHATPELWKQIFGYPPDYTAEFGDIGLVFGNTSNAKGEYVCPDNSVLESNLKQFVSKKTVFVVLHIPPHQWLPEETFFKNCHETMDLIHSFPNVKALFHGHDHNLDSVRYTSKLPHFFDGHFGGNWGTEYKGYRVVEVSEDNRVSTYQVNASRNPKVNALEIK